jgi:hypothetical protein
VLSAAPRPQVAAFSSEPWGWGGMPVAPSPQSPVIDWSVAQAPADAPASPVAARGGNWQDEFVNHMAKTEAQRKPNAAMRVQVDVNPKLGAARPIL